MTDANFSARPDWELLDRFWAGECSAEEAAAVRRWLEANPRVAATLGMVRNVADAALPAESGVPTWDRERAWQRVTAETRERAGAVYRVPPPLRRVDTREAIPIDTVTRRSVPRWAAWRARSWGRIAAAALLLGSAGALVWQSTPSVKPSISASAPRVITTQRSARADFRLPDGTRVILAPESRLVISADFGRAHRTVTLVGEGYFEAIHDSTMPFLVRASYGVVHDLGTRFSVRAYPQDSSIRIVVAEGRVAAGLASAGIPVDVPVLARGDLARLDSTGLVTVHRGVDADLYQSLTEGRLQFDAAPLREVLRELTRWYDVDFKLHAGDDDVVPLGQRRVTLTLTDESLVDVLSAIANVTNTRYRQLGRTVTFTALGNPPSVRRP